jgi:DnaJ-class molecular chaperone
MVHAYLVYYSIETLGVTKEAKEEDIEKAYAKLKEYFGNSEDANMRIYFDDVTLYY